MALYDDGFYDSQEAGSLASARAIVPFVLKLLQPKSVVDVGCGVGTWLSVYQENGIQDILGFDGHYVDQSRLYIDKHNFVAHDLSQAILLDRQFELVQSLEVAEHINAENADQFVASITSLGNAVLFGAAIPYQLGTGHINEQFVDYWTPLFAKRDFYPVDCVRPHFWDDEGIEVWYRQNTLLYLRSDLREQFLLNHPDLLDDRLLSVVHPELYSQRISMLLKLLTEVGGQLQNANNIPLAENLYRLVLHHDGARADTHAALALLMAKTSRFQDALEAMNRSIEIDASIAANYFVRGNIYLQLKKSDSATEDFATALRLDGNLQVAREALAALQR